MSRPTNPAGYPYVRLASVALRIPPEEGPPEFTLALDSVNSGTGSLSSDPWSQTAAVGNRYEPGDVLFGKLRPYLAKVWVADRIGNYVGDFMRIVPRDSFDSDFLKYVFLTPEFISKATAESVGSKMPRTEWDALKDLQIPSPTRVQQQQIADYLDHETAEIDAFIADLEFMQSLVLERGEAERDKMIWDANQRLIPLRRLISYVDQGSSPQATSTPAGPGEVGILKSGCTNFGQFNPNANKAIPEGMEIPENYFVEEGDLIVSRASGSTKHVASTAVVPALDRLLALSDKHYRLHMNYGVDVHYIATVMQSMPFRNQLEPYISGASGLAKNISLSALKSMTVPALPAADQSHIGNKARESFLKIRETTQSIATAVDLARERRAAFITAAVTGQIDVTAKNKPAAEQLEDDIAQGLHKES